MMLLMPKTTPRIIRSALAMALALSILPLVTLGCSETAAQSNGDSSNRSAATGPDQLDWFTVTRSSFPLNVTASGELQAKRSIDLKCEVEGNSIIASLVDEGTSVKGPRYDEAGELIAPGDLLIKLADDEIKEKVEQETLSVERARSEYITAEQALTIHESEAVSNRSAAELKVELARLELEKWEQGDARKRRLELDLALKKSKHNLERAKENLVLSEQLYEEEFISRQEVEDDRIALDEAENAVKTATLDIEVYEQFTHPKEKKQFTSDVEQAEAELSRVIRKNDSDLEKYRADKLSKERTLRIREDRLASLKDQLAKTEIRAPQDGLVVYATSTGSHWRRDDPLIVGRQVRYNEKLINLPDTSQMVAAVRVHEARLQQVEAGQSVTVRVVARQDRPMTGTVTSIGVMAESGGWMNPDLREYIVRVELPQNGDPSLKPGMRCNADILTGQVDDAIAVPVQAVQSRGRERFVYVPAENNKVRSHTVKIGRASESLVEILEGLDVGDRVLLRKPRPGEAIDEEQESPARPTA